MNRVYLVKDINLPPARIRPHTGAPQLAQRIHPRATSQRTCSRTSCNDKKFSESLSVGAHNNRWTFYEIGQPVEHIVLLPDLLSPLLEEVGWIPSNHAVINASVRNEIILAERHLRFSYYISSIRRMWMLRWSHVAVWELLVSPRPGKRCATDGSINATGE
ncbi:hypothetical protein CBL_01891, partial [Carabus blaptoides fortunei]